MHVADGVKQMNPAELKVGHFYRAAIRRGLLCRKDRRHTAIVKIEEEHGPAGWTVTDVGLSERMVIGSADLLVEEAPVREYMAQPEVVRRQCMERARRNLRRERPGIVVTSLIALVAAVGFRWLLFVFAWAIENDRFEWSL